MRVSTSAIWQHHGMQSGEHPVRQRRILLLVGLTLLLGAGALVLGMIEEPYHIDELRQVRSYDPSWRGVAGEALRQQQPPLDPLIGSVIQKVFGQGHVIQRLHPTILGLGSLVLLSMLLWRSGLRVGVPVAVLLYGIAPIVVSVTAYARPYALPIFLSLAFLVGGDLWLREGRRWGAVAAGAAAVLLPLSRAVEPVIFLLVAIAALYLSARRNDRWRRSPWVLLIVAGASVILIALPLCLRLRSELAEFTADSSTSLVDRVGRIVEELAHRLDEAFIVGGLALALLALAFLSPGLNRFLRSEWWAWPLIAVPVGFTVAFFLLARSDQPYYPRYGYSWWLPFAIVIGVLADRLFRDRSTLAVDAATAFLMVLFTAAVANALVEDLTTNAWVDYEPLGEEIEARLDLTTVVLFDDAVVFGAYRAGYAGYERFTAEARLIRTAPQIVINPQRVPDDRPFVVVINGPPVDVPGWARVEASNRMNLYLPEDPGSGRSRAAATLSAFGTALGPGAGSMLRLAAASLLIQIGDLEQACAEVDETVEGVPGLAESVRARHPSTELVQALSSCPGGDPLGR
jgi:hypothetical protein